MFNFIRVAGLITLFVTFVPTQVLAAKVGLATWQGRDLLLSFVGKGTSVSIDAGVLKALNERMPDAIQSQRLILSGSSSGSIPATFLSCFGVSPATTDALKRFIVDGTPEINRALDVLRASENPFKKAIAMAQGQVPALPIENLNAYVAAALGIEGVTGNELMQLTPDVVNQRAKCKPQVPVVIVAANQEILENRLDPARFTIGVDQMDVVNKRLKANTVFKSRGDKLVDYANFSVSWKPARHRAYLTAEGNKLFQQNHPQLNLRKDGLVGKLCTYFADEEAANLLLAVPYAERLCDVRIMRTAYDRLVAIWASSAEPTYFKMVKEPAPALLDPGTGLGAMQAATAAPRGEAVDAKIASSRERLYWGGFVMPSVTQDIRRMLPHIHVLATGFNRLDMEQEGKVIEAFSLVRSDEISKRTEYWSDFMVRFDDATQKKIRGREMTRQEEYQVGYNETKVCLDREKNEVEGARACRPLSRDVVDPEDDEITFHSGAAAEAIFSDEQAKNDLEGERLPVWRGIGKFLE